MHVENMKSAPGDIHSGCQTKSVGRFPYQDLCSADLSTSTLYYVCFLHELHYSSSKIFLGPFAFIFMQSESDYVHVMVSTSI